VIEEVLAAGIEEVVFITGRGKGAIMDHFDHSYELEDTLRKRGQTELIKQIEAISRMVRAVSVRQKAPLGLGHAVLCAKSVVGDEPFAVLLPDDIIDARVPATRQLVEQAERYGSGAIAVMQVPESEVDRYGIIASEPMSERTHRIYSLVEKPKPSVAPSRLAVIGRYVLPGEIFGYLENTQPGHGGEIQLTDALQALARDRGLVGYEFEGERHDIGDKYGFIRANIDFALKRPDLGPELRAYLRTKLSH
jgi:UTP--glucose-1-phosphate uridylyltransferase